MNGPRLKLELRRARRPFLVWAALIALGVLSTTLLVVRIQAGLSDGYTVRIAVPDAKGFVSPYSQVRIAGVRVGRITKVDYDGTDAVLTASMEPQAGPLYRDARLRLRPNSPLEDMLVEVVRRGTPSAGKIPEGGELTADHTLPAVSISEVLNTFDPKVRPQVTELLTELGHGLEDGGANLRAVLVKLGPFLDVARKTTTAFADREHLTRQLIHNLGLLTTEVADRDRTVADLVASSSKTAKAISIADRPLGDLLDGLPPLMAQIPRTLATVRGAAEHLDPALTALRPAARELPSALRSLTSLGVSARRPLRDLTKPVPDVTRLLREAPEATKPLTRSFSKLRPQAPRLERMTDATIGCRTELQQLLARLLSVFKYSDHQGSFARAEDVVGAEVGGVVEVPYFKKRPGCEAGGDR